MKYRDAREHWIEQADQASWALVGCLVAANLFGLAGALAHGNRGLFALMFLFGALEIIAAGRVVYCLGKYRNVGRNRGRGREQAVHVEEHPGD